MLHNANVIDPAIPEKNKKKNRKVATLSVALALL